MMYGFLRYGAWTDRIFYFGPIFALLPHEQTKNQNLKKMKKTTGDIIILHILHKCTINENHMMYGS